MINHAQASLQRSQGHPKSPGLPLNTTYAYKYQWATTLNFVMWEVIFIVWYAHWRGKKTTTFGRNQNIWLTTVQIKANDSAEKKIKKMTYNETLFCFCNFANARVNFVGHIMFILLCNLRRDHAWGRK